MGYDLSHQVPFRLMKGRLGVYDKRPFDPKTAMEPVNEQSTRMRQQGGHLQQERMIKDKRRSLQHAIWYSYQGAEIRKIDATDKKPYRALINPNKLTQDYDNKILSIGFEYNVKVGDIFEWVGTNTHWIVYLQDLTELAYFRGNIRRCSYQIAWQNDVGDIYTTYAAIRGPVETRINYIQKHEISIDTPNHSLNILMPSNDETLKYFKRYSKFYLQGSDICWRVEGLDWISTPGILEVAAVEYYANESEDNINNGIVGGLMVKEENPNDIEIESIIVGETFIKVKKEYSFKYEGMDNLESQTWYVDPKIPVSLQINPDDPTEVRLIWNATYSGQFDLHYGKYIKTIIVESLF